MVLRPFACATSKRTITGRMIFLIFDFYHFLFQYGRRSYSLGLVGYLRTLAVKTGVSCPVECYKETNCVAVQVGEQAN